MNHNRLPKTLLFVLAVQLTASAATISFVGGDGVSDGLSYVSPYTVEIEGHRYRAMCYDLANHVSPGQVWQANLLTFDDLGGAYYFGRADAEDKYRKAGWYYSELMKVSDAESRIGIQHAAWLLFDSSSPATGAASWQAAAELAAQNGYASVDFSTLRFIEAVAGTPRVQGLLVGGFASSASAVPEPSTWTVVVVGGGLLALGKRWARAAGLPGDRHRT